MSTKCQAVLGAEGTQRCEITGYDVHETSSRKTSWVGAAETLVRNEIVATKIVAAGKEEIAKCKRC